MPKKKGKNADAPAPNFPAHHPEAISNLANAMPWKTRVRFFEVEAYADAIRKLYDRGYSYEEITNWLNEKLADKLAGKLIKRGQVYRVHQQSNPTDIGFPDEFFVRHITDEEAETEAAESDKKPRKDEKDQKP